MENREIKFRAWHKGANEMLTGEAHRVLTWEAEGQPLEIMQFAGLNDKNGKEIYEGDILRTATDKPMVVSWNEKFASFCLDRDGWAFSHWFGESCNPQDCEIIGNIYENPELLTPITNKH